jgi:hypothetical protein
MSTTYLASAALAEVERAQAELERHLAVRPGGQCVTCGEAEPCSGRQRAGSTFLRYGCLPRRRPGASGVRRADPTPASTEPASWFASEAKGDGDEGPDQLMQTSPLRQAASP